jgi:hydroxymethylpyrimidine pyrophosphatase-like HAD family hydrolase
MSHLRLLSTDFDGTLISHFSDGRCAPDFAAVLSEHKKSGGLWAVNTGRSLWHAIEGVEKFQPPVQPDFLLTNEREIFHRTPDGRWVPEQGWNETCYQRHDDLFVRATPIFDRIRELALEHPGINLAEEKGQLAGVITSDEEVMHEFVSFLETHSREMPEFSYQRNTIYLRFAHIDYHKGSCLGELCRILQISPAEVLAAGDHFNDIPMLDGRYAAHPCCPSNAIPEVRVVVESAGGHLASKPAAEGVAESWHFFHANHHA